MTSSRLLATVTAVALAAWAPPLAAERPSGEAEAGVELGVAAVFDLPGGEESVLVLRERGGASLLPIFVARTEARSVEERLRGRAAPFPVRSGHGLDGASGAGAPTQAWPRLLSALGARLERVEIRVFHEALFRARLHLRQEERELAVEARPSEAVALALGCGAPIYATPEVMRNGALTPGDLDRMRRGTRAALDEDPPTVSF